MDVSGRGGSSPPNWCLEANAGDGRAACAVGRPDCLDDVAEEAGRMKGLSTKALREKLGDAYARELIHIDDLVVL